MNEKQSQLVIDKLNVILNKQESIVDNTANIRINANSVNLNTDQVEQKLDTVNTNLDENTAEIVNLIAETHLIDLDVEDVKTKLDTLNAKDFSTQTTLLAFKNEQKTESDETQVKIDAANALLTQIRDYVDTVETKLQSILDEINSIDTYGSTQTSSTVAASSTSVLLKASNTERRELIIRNNSSKILYITFSTPATTSTPIYLNKDEIWVEDRWLGDIYGIWESSATGNAFIIEVSE